MPMDNEDDQTGESDMQPSGDDKPQEDQHPNITRPQEKLKKTNETLALLGAGQPYMNRNY